MAQMNPLEGNVQKRQMLPSLNLSPKTKALTAVTKRIMIEEFGRAY